MRIALAVALLLAAIAPSALAQPAGTQITIAQPAEATTMDPGRSTQVLTVNYFYNPHGSLSVAALAPGLTLVWIDG